MVLTVLVLVVFPPPQSNVAPAVVDDAVSITLVTAQVRVAGVAIAAFGGVIFLTTMAEAMVKHPLTGSVTVTV